MPVQAQANLAGAILAEIPRMRAYARLMTNDRLEADREVEETLKCVLADDIRWSEKINCVLRSLKSCAAFSPGNAPSTPSRSPRHIRRLLLLVRSTWLDRRQGSRGDTGWPRTLAAEFRGAGSDDLSAAAGFTDLEIAGICGCARETVKERVQSGPARLAELWP